MVTNTPHLTELCFMKISNVFLFTWNGSSCLVDGRCRIFSCLGGLPSNSSVLVVRKYTYLPPTYPNFIQDIEDRYLLLMSSTSFVDLPFQEHRIMEKHHMDQNPCIASLCLKYGIVTNNITWGDDVAQSSGPTKQKWAGWLGVGAISISALPTCQGGSVHGVSDAQRQWRPSWVADRPARVWWVTASNHWWSSLTPSINTPIPPSVR
jgi:hypothetical protein